MQKIDTSIALCHFMGDMGGEPVLSDPGIPTGENTDHIATVRV